MALALSVSENEHLKPQELIPVPARRVKALFDFTPIENGDLAFRKGDVIEVVGAVYRDWWRGTLDGKTGIFPINYVQILEDKNDEGEKSAEGECRVCFDESAEYCLVPCGHTGFCSKCALRLKECPFCKKQVRHGMKLFKT